MCYSTYSARNKLRDRLAKEDLTVIVVFKRYYDLGSRVCTNRPSLSLKGEISRNKVGVLESAPRSIKM